MPSFRPGSVTAAAVLSIIYGSLFTLCGLCGVVSLAAQGAMGKNFLAGGDPMQVQLQKQLEDALQREVPGYQAFQVVGTIISLGEALALLIAGIGLLSMQPWARTLAIVVCLIAMVSTGFQAVYQSAFIIPAMNKAFQVALPAALPQGAGPQAAEVLRVLRTMMTLIAIVTVILYGLILIYLVIIVVLLSRAHVRAAFETSALAGFEGLTDQERRSSYEDDRGWDRPRPPDYPDDDWRNR